jgi:D-galactarolactone cycloisomerase
VKIARVEVFAVRANMSVPRGPSILTYHTRETLVIKITSEDGVVGWGETYRMAGVEAALRDALAPLLIGRDALEIRRLHREMLAATFGNGFAVGGVDLALHDLVGKALGVPVHQLYDGAVRSRVSAYASLPGYYDDREPREHWVDEVVSLRRDGFTAMKLRIGRYGVDVEAPLLDAVRSAVGPSVRLMCDGNAAYSPALALRMGATLAELDFAWFEEPLPQNGYRGYPELRAKLRLPLAGGEGVTSRVDANAVLQRGCFDIIQPDVSICGGIAECLLIGELADLSAVRCIPHCWGGAIMLAATVQVAALLPEPSRMPGLDAPLLEFDVTENPFRTEIVVDNPFALHDGCVLVPDRPGLGVDVDESALVRYAVQRG